MIIEVQHTLQVTTRHTLSGISDDNIDVKIALAAENGLDGILHVLQRLPVAPVQVQDADLRDRLVVLEDLEHEGHVSERAVADLSHTLGELQAHRRQLSHIVQAHGGAKWQVRIIPAQEDT